MSDHMPFSVIAASHFSSLNEGISLQYKSKKKIFVANKSGECFLNYAVQGGIDPQLTATASCE